MMPTWSAMMSDVLFASRSGADNEAESVNG